MDRKDHRKGLMNRRDFIKASLLTGGLAAPAVAAAIERDSISLRGDESVPPGQDGGHEGHGGHDAMGAIGEVDHEANGFNPYDILYDWDYGEVSMLPGGQRLREYKIVAIDKEIEVAPGIFFPAWLYNGRAPGPSLRAVEGDRIRITFVNAGSHPHTIHFHGIHSAAMDGVPGVGAGNIAPSQSTVYEFDAEPFGCHLYHCHALPLTRHIHKGLYGAFIVDPDPKRYAGTEKEVAKTRNYEYEENKRWNEMLMVMNAFDTDFDSENEVYAVNSIAFAYSRKPIEIKRDQPQRIYLINITEFDPINSFHLHANFFDYFDHGTTLQPTLKTVDTIMQCQAQRGILEFSYEGFEPGRYMFHAHQSEFAELGWMSFFEVVS